MTPNDWEQWWQSGNPTPSDQDYIDNLEAGNEEEPGELPDEIPDDIEEFWEDYYGELYEEIYEDVLDVDTSTEMYAAEAFVTGITIA